MQNVVLTSESRCRHPANRRVVPVGHGGRVLQASPGTTAAQLVARKPVLLPLANPVRYLGRSGREDEEPHFEQEEFRQAAGPQSG